MRLLHTRCYKIAEHTMPHIDLDWRREESALHPGVYYEIRPLKVWAYLELLGAWDKGAAEAPAATPRAAEAPAPEGAPVAELGALPRQGRLLRLAPRIFPEHVRALEGLEMTREGVRLPVDAIALAEEAALAPLAGEVITRLLEISQLTGADEKN